MAAKVGDFSLILKLLGGIIIGALLGLYIGENAEGSLKHVMDVVVSLRHIFGQIIFFLVPLVIVGFITPASCVWARTPARSCWWPWPWPTSPRWARPCSP